MHSNQTDTNWWTDCNIHLPALHKQVWHQFTLTAPAITIRSYCYAVHKMWTVANVVAWSVCVFCLLNTLVSRVKNC